MPEYTIEFIAVGCGDLFCLFKISDNTNQHRKMKVIRFRRQGKINWEIAFNEAHLHEKLNGDTAEIIMPSKPWYVRMWRKIFPLRFTECSVSRQNVES